jgi:hypothetical protein
MARGTSWSVDRGSAAYRKIVLVLERGGSDVRWTTRCSDWIGRHFDSTRWTKSILVSEILEHIRREGRIRGQRGDPGFASDQTFSVEIEMDGELRFIKFILEPDDDDSPGIIIVSTHPPH